MKFHAIFKIQLVMLPGSRIQQACKEAVLVCQQLNHKVEFEFNGDKVLVMPGDSIEELLGRLLKDTIKLDKIEAETEEYRLIRLG
jgi:hypothetical protein